MIQKYLANVPNKEILITLEWKAKFEKIQVGVNFVIDGIKSLKFFLSHMILLFNLVILRYSMAKLTYFWLSSINLKIPSKS